VAANVLRGTAGISGFAKIDPRYPWPTFILPPGTPYPAVPNPYPASDPYTSYASFCGYRPANANLSGTTTDTTVCWAPTTKTKLWGTNLTVDWKLTDSMALKSITAYRRFDSRWVEDNDATPASIGLGAEHQSNHSFSEELRLSGKVGSLVDYTVGAYYFDQLTIGRTHQMLNYVGIPFPFPFVFEFLGNDPTPASSYAGFANVAWHVMDRLNINLGGRYTHEKKDYTYSRIDPVTGLPNILIGGLTGVTGHYDGSKTDYRVNVDYRWTDALMTYASVSTGFKGGGTNPRPFNVLQVHSFNPETLTAYEIGAKTDFLDRRVRLNVAGFFNKFKDIQVTLLACPQFDGNPNGPCAAPVNGGDADIKGVEAELEARPVDRLSIEGSWSKLSFKYTRIDPLSGIPDGALAPGDIEDKWSAAIQYEFPLAGGGSITPRYDHTYQGGYNTNAIPTPGNRVAGRHLDNAQITWKSADDKWQASLIGSNLADKYYYVSVFDLTGLGGGTNYGFVAPPREFSVQVQKKF
jgi:iron complex outermembrane receptor protein